MIEIVCAWWLAASVARVREPDQHDDERRHNSKVAVSLGDATEPHHAVAGTSRAGDDHEPEDEQRIDEDRAKDRRLGNDLLAGVEREDNDEELGKVPKRCLH